MVTETNGSIDNRHSRKSRKPGMRNPRALDRANPGRHQHRRDDHRRPLRLIAEVVFVMGVPGFKSTEERRDDRRDRHLFLEAAFAHVLRPTDWLMFAREEPRP